MSFGAAGGGKNEKKKIMKSEGINAWAKQTNKQINK